MSIRSRSWSKQKLIKIQKEKKKKDSCWIESLAARSAVLNLVKGGNAMLRLLLTVAAWA